MELQPHDLHLVLDAQARTGKLFAADGNLLLSFEARNRTVNDGSLSTWGNCPPGEYLLGPPIAKDTPPFGPYFLLMSDYGPNTAMADHGRIGIGIHGGGSGLPNPLAPHQSPPWVVTRGCFRMVNADLELLAHQVKAAQGVGGRCYATVVAPRPGGSAIGPEDYLDVREDQLDPAE